MYNNSMADELATWLKQEMASHGWSLRELARHAGISHTAILNVLKGHTRPSALFCTKIAQALRVPAEEVYRRAGLLPAVPPEEASLLEANYLFAQLSESEQETVLTMMRALVEKRREAPRPYSAEAG